MFSKKNGFFSVFGDNKEKKRDRNTLKNVFFYVNGKGIFLCWETF